MREAIADLDEVLVITRVSKTVMPLREPTGQILSDSLVVFATDSYSDQTVLSSTAHQLWAIKYGSGMRNDPRYTPSDVLETFPRPAAMDSLDKIGRRLDNVRRKIMLPRQLGLTTLQPARPATSSRRPASGRHCATSCGGRGPVRLRVYLDTQAARPTGSWVPPTPAEVAAWLRPGAVFRTVDVGGHPVRNHVKFLVIDHRFVLVTSPNFSASAELRNVELGVKIDDAGLAKSIEREVRRAEEQVYQRVEPTGGP